MPNWRNPEDYTRLKSIDLHEWAWEFLRRNPEFREAYFELEKIAASGTFREIDDDPAKRKALRLCHIAATAPWDLALPADPRRDFQEARVFFKKRAGVEILDSWKAPKCVREEYAKWPGYPEVVALKFDLKYSIEISIEIAAEHLRRLDRQLRKDFDYQPRAPKSRNNFRVRQFPLYVRILDAELDRVPINEMGRVLFPRHKDKRKNLKEVRETARKMTSEGYRQLLLLPPRPRNV